jgi:glutathione S-transferase
VIQRSFRRVLVRRQALQALLQREDLQWQERQRRQTEQALAFLDAQSAQVHWLCLRGVCVLLPASWMDAGPCSPDTASY